jgi:hypothetical protein
MRRALFCAVLMLVSISDHAKAFIFTDLVAKAQRIEMIAQAGELLNRIDAYREEFDKYKKVFDQYYRNFKRVYRHLPGGWESFSSRSWGGLRDHLIRIWKTFDEPAWQAQILALRTTPLYSTNSDYRVYADRLVELSEAQIVHLKKEEAQLINLQAQDAEHYEALERFRSANASLVLGNNEDDPVALSQQVALTNAILIELASIQAESKIVEQRLLTQQKEARNLIMRMKQLEIEAQRGDLRNLDQLMAMTKSK